MNLYNIKKVSIITLYKIRKVSFTLYNIKKVSFILYNIKKVSINFIQH